MPSSRLPLVFAVAALVVVLGGFAVFQQFLAGDDIARLTLAPITTATASSTTCPRNGARRQRGSVQV